MPSGQINAESEGGPFNLNRIGIMVAAGAVVLAAISISAQRVSNVALTGRIQASNSWAFYQSKRARSTQLELARDSAMLFEKQNQVALSLRRKYTDDIERYHKESQEILEQAKKFESSALRAEQKSQVFGWAELLVQISIMLSALSLLTRQTLYYQIGSALAVFACGFLFYGWFT